MIGVSNMKASEARILTAIAKAEELNVIMSSILESAKDGCNGVVLSINHKSTRDELRGLGYNVELVRIDSESGDETHSITW